MIHTLRVNIAEILLCKSAPHTIRCPIIVPAELGIHIYQYPIINKITETSYHQNHVGAFQKYPQGQH